MNNTMHFLRQNMKILMYQQEMNTAELARRAKMSRQTIINIRNGHTTSITTSTLDRLAEALGVNYSWELLQP